MVINNTNAVATIIQAVSPEFSVAASSAAAGAASAAASWAISDSTGNNVTANTKSTLVSVPNRGVFFMLI